MDGTGVPWACSQDPHAQPNPVQPYLNLVEELGVQERELFRNFMAVEVMQGPWPGIHSWATEGNEIGAPMSNHQENSLRACLPGSATSCYPAQRMVERWVQIQERDKRHGLSRALDRQRVGWQRLTGLPHPWLPGAGQNWRI